MHSGRRAVGVIFALFCLAGFFPALGATRAQAAENPAALKGSYRFERAHWIYIHLEGTPEHIGFQHGYLLAPEIEQAFHAARLDNTHSTGRPWQFFRDTAKNIYWPHIETEYRQELEGIADGVKANGIQDIDLWDVVALNAFLETPQYYVPWLDAKKKSAKADPPAHGNCSAFVVTGEWTRDHHPVIAHSMWYPFMTGEYWRIIFDIEPEHGYRILMDGFPGKIDSGDDFGMNSAGIAITETTITGFLGFDPNAVPEFVRARKAMQYAGSIDDFAHIMLEGNNGGYANDWLIADNRANEVARFELGLKVHHLWRTKNGFFVGSNFPSDPALIKLETDFNPENPASSMNARHKRWDELMAADKGKIDAHLAEKFLADHLDVVENKEGADERTLCGHTDASPRGVPEWESLPYSADGAVNAKTADGEMIRRLSFFARSGRPCGEDFLADKFLAAHPGFGWQKPALRDMKGNPWTSFHGSDHGDEGHAGAGN